MSNLAKALSGHGEYEEAQRTLRLTFLREKVLRREHILKQVGKFHPDTPKSHDNHEDSKRIHQ